MAYDERIKNFEKIRDYMQAFYVYGLKSRLEYDHKSARSYDDERRRLESWLRDYMQFHQTADGKNVFLAIDSRASKQNPLYKAWKAKRFTDATITLHFAIFDVLYSPAVKMTLADLTEAIDARLASRLTFDESTLRKKLNDYIAAEIIQVEKIGRKNFYHRSPLIDIQPLADALDFFSEVAPCGVIGSFLQDRLADHEPLFSFKHHYITQTMDSDIMAQIFQAMHDRVTVTVDYPGQETGKFQKLCLLPLKIYLSVQNGRQYLMAFNEAKNRIYAYRLDKMKNIQLKKTVSEDFVNRRADLTRLERHMWGVSSKRLGKTLEQVTFELRIGDDESHIIRRLKREKRCGQVDRLDRNHYRFTANVFDANELFPWIRTFICRITRLDFSNPLTKEKFKSDLEAMYRLYDLEGGGPGDFQ